MMSGRDVALSALTAVGTVTMLSLVMEVPLWLAMLVNSLAAIIVGSILSASQDPTDKKNDDSSEVIGSKEALRFPLVASGFLLSLYLLVKYLNKDLVNVVLSVYFTFLGICCLKGYIRTAIERQIKPYLPSFEFKKKLQVPYVKDPLDCGFDACDVVCYALACSAGLLYFNSKHWVLNNLLGLAFAIYGVEKISLGSFKIGAIMLGGLFFYDIFWVYGTDVMLTVAKSIDAPIKLLFPKPLSDITEGGFPFSLLGLGDIIVPGIFLSLAYRFDVFMEKKLEKRRKPAYFLAGLASYVLGLLATLIVMKVFNAGQPALLYLVPSTLSFVYGTAVLKGELTDLLAYEES
jgi:minor histocompatibility antigen H13